MSGEILPQVAAPGDQGSMLEIRGRRGRCKRRCRLLFFRREGALCSRAEALADGDRAPRPPAGRNAHETTTSEVRQSLLRDADPQDHPPTAAERGRQTAPASG